MPVLTRSKRASARTVAPALLARWRQRGSSPAAAAAARASRNRASWASVVAVLAASSATAKWLQRPSTSSPGSAMAAATSAGSSAGSQPWRCMPVSTLRWAASGRPARRPAMPKARTPARVQRVTAIPSAAQASAAAGWGSDSTSSGAEIPARRSSSASSTSATPSQAAPARTAARATGTAPCP